MEQSGLLNQKNLTTGSSILVEKDALQTGSRRSHPLSAITTCLGLVTSGPIWRCCVLMCYMFGPLNKRQDGTFDYSHRQSGMVTYL